MTNTLDNRELGPPLDAHRFDLVFHPCSNSFTDDVRPVWREAHRVMKAGARLLAGFTNPVRYIFRDERHEDGSLEVCYQIPYSDAEQLDPARMEQVRRQGEALEFGHTLEDQIGGQLAAGLHLVGFYEDRYADSEHDPISRYLATFIATCAVKPRA